MSVNYAVQAMKEAMREEARMTDVKDAALTMGELDEIARDFANWPELEPLTRMEAEKVLRLVSEVRRLQFALYTQDAPLTEEELEHARLLVEDADRLVEQGHASHVAWFDYAPRLLAEVRRLRAERLRLGMKG